MSRDKKVESDALNATEPNPQIMTDINADNGTPPHPITGEKAGKVKRPSATRTGVGLESNVQKHIGRCLQDAYSELVNEPVPDQFVKLLDDLAAKDKNR